MRTRSLSILAGVALAAAALLSFAPRADAAKEVFVREKPHVNIAVMGIGPELTAFSEVAGLGVATDLVVAPGGPRPVPGATHYPDVTLKRGLTSTLDLYDWATEGVDGVLMPRDLKIMLLGPSAEPASTFELVNCFPIRYEISTDDKHVATETVVVRCEQVKLIGE